MRPESLAEMKNALELQAFRFGPFYFDSSDLLFEEGHRIPLEPIHARVLRALLVGAGRIVTKLDLIEKGWHGGDVSDESISRAVYKVRRALGQRKDEYIEAISGKGYRFVVPVEEVLLPSCPIRVAVRAFTMCTGDPVSPDVLAVLVASRLRDEGMLVVAEQEQPASAVKTDETTACFEVRGNVRAEGRRYRIQIRFLRKAKESLVWHEEFVASASELPDVARQIARRIVDSARREASVLELAPGTRESAAGLLTTARALASDLDSMMGYWDMDLRCRYANSAYEVWFGRSQSSMRGIFMPELLGRLFEMNLPYIKRVESGLPQHFRRLITLPNGIVRSSLASYLPDVRDGRVRGFSVLVVDADKYEQQ
jgi:DNA-binding winged helix-turn-helix (wHTH) protein/PAS domain-containing protein